MTRPLAQSWTASLEARIIAIGGSEIFDLEETGRLVTRMAGLRNAIQQTAYPPARDR